MILKICQKYLHVLLHDQSGFSVSCTVPGYLHMHIPAKGWFLSLPCNFFHPGHQPPIHSPLISRPLCIFGKQPYGIVLLMLSRHNFPWFSPSDPNIYLHSNILYSYYNIYLTYVQLLACYLFTILSPNFIFAHFYICSFIRPYILPKGFFLWFDSIQFVHYNKNNVTYTVT